MGKRNQPKPRNRKKPERKIRTSKGRKEKKEGLLDKVLGVICTTLLGAATVYLILGILIVAIVSCGDVSLSTYKWYHIIFAFIIATLGWVALIGFVSGFFPQWIEVQ